MHRMVLGFVLCALCTVAGLPAHAQASGTVSIDIDFPPLVILYYYGSLTVSIPDTVLNDTLFAGDIDVDLVPSGTQAVTVGTGMDGDASISVPALTPSPTSVPMIVSNSWAVRSVGSSTQNTVVTVTPVDSILDNGSAQLAFNSVGLRLGAQTGASVSFTPVGLGTPVIGDLTFDMDLSAASFSGTYTGGSFTISATTF